MCLESRFGEGWETIARSFSSSNIYQQIRFAPPFDIIDVSHPDTKQISVSPNQLTFNPRHKLASSFPVDFSKDNDVLDETILVADPLPLAGIRGFYSVCEDAETCQMRPTTNCLEKNISCVHCFCSTKFFSEFVKGSPWHPHTH